MVGTGCRTNMGVPQNRGSVTTTGGVPLRASLGSVLSGLDPRVGSQHIQPHRRHQSIAYKGISDLVLCFTTLALRVQPNGLIPYTRVPISSLFPFHALFPGICSLQLILRFTCNVPTPQTLNPKPESYDLRQAMSKTWSP